MSYLNSTLNFGIPTVLVFQLEVYYKVDRLLTGITAQPKGTTARWYSNNSFFFSLFQIFLSVEYPDHCILSLKEHLCNNKMVIVYFLSYFTANYYFFPGQFAT